MCASLQGYGAEGPRLEVHSAGDTSRIEALWVVAAPVEAVWRCIAEYDRLSSLMPSIEESRVLRREGDTALRLFQRLRLRVFPGFPVSVYFEFRVREYPPVRLEFEDVRQAYFTLYRGQWELRSVGRGKTEIRYRVEFCPRPLLKPLLRRMPAAFTEHFVREFQTGLQRGCIP